MDCGRKQGCNLLPIFFNKFINDLAVDIKNANKGIKIEDAVRILFFANDIILIAEGEEDLQHNFDILNDWCERWKMQVNASKTKVVHFWNPSVPKTQYNFTVAKRHYKKYKYLGLWLTEFLYGQGNIKNCTPSSVPFNCQIKSTQHGGMPYRVFTYLYNELVLPIIQYGAAVWCQNEFSCITAVYNRACGFYLGVGRRTLNAAISGSYGVDAPMTSPMRLYYQSRVQTMDG